MKKTYTHIVRSKITGQAYSRHTSQDLAVRAVRRKTTDRDPLEVVQYSDEYWTKMGPAKY
jgi:hypothetical protein